MSMSGYLNAADRKEWYERNRQAQVDSAEAWKKEQEEKSGGKIVRQSRSYAGRNGFVDYTAPPKRRPGSPEPAGRDLTKCTPAERAAHQRAMLEAHKDRFKDAHWTHTIPILEKAQKEDVLAESVSHRLYGSNKKFIVQKDMPTRARATRDVDNHLFTGAVHREAESEQMTINRMIRNHEIEISDQHALEDFKDDMDDVRRERASEWKDKAVPTSLDSEVPL